MRRLSLRTPGRPGLISYVILPVLAVASIMGAVVYLPAVGQADTVNCAQMTGTFQASSDPAVPYNEDGQKDGTAYHCVQYLQQIINARDAFVVVENTSASAINGYPITALTNGSQFYSVNNQFGTTSNVYSAGMQNGVANLQQWDNAPSESYIQKYFGMTAATFGKVFRPYGNLPANGTTERKTWYDLCQWMNQIPVSARTTTISTDYIGGVPNAAGSNKTNMWYLRSYMRAGYTAAADSGCAAALQTTSSTGALNPSPTPPTVPTAVQTTAALSKLTVTWSAVSGATRYNVRIFKPDGTTLRVSTVPVTHAVYSIDTVGHSGTTNVQACNAAGCSNWSAPKEFRFQLAE